MAGLKYLVQQAGQRNCAKLSCAKVFSACLCHAVQNIALFRWFGRFPRRAGGKIIHATWAKSDERNAKRDAPGEGRTPDLP